MIDHLEFTTHPHLFQTSSPRHEWTIPDALQRAEVAAEAAGARAIVLKRLTIQLAVAQVHHVAAYCFSEGLMAQGLEVETFCRQYDLNPDRQRKVLRGFEDLKVEDLALAALYLDDPHALPAPGDVVEIVHGRQQRLSPLPSRVRGDASNFETDLGSSGGPPPRLQVHELPTDVAKRAKRALEKSARILRVRLPDEALAKLEVTDLDIEVGSSQDGYATSVCGFPGNECLVLRAWLSGSWSVEVADRLLASWQVNDGVIDGHFIFSILEEDGGRPTEVRALVLAPDPGLLGEHIFQTRRGTVVSDERTGLPILTFPTETESET